MLVNYRLDYYRLSYVFLDAILKYMNLITEINSIVNSDIYYLI